MLTRCTPHPTRINDFDWFGIATDGPIVGSLEIGVFPKPRLWAGKSVYKHANIISKCVLRGAEPLPICSGWARQPPTHMSCQNV